MSDGLLAKQAHMNTGAIPTSAEDLAEKHQALLHEYSRLKAKYTVLKKAVIKEQSTNNTLQGNVKEKEKELRKLQEQLDLLAFHNERLTKRIEAVQDHEQKGSHFSLLGGAMKKELEKNTQALDAANLDLSKKIEENERLHEELSENHHIYTNHVNELHIQIAKLEKQVEELQVEISTIQKDRRDQLAALKQEKAALQSELDKLKQDLADKSRILTENETSLKQNDIDLRSELESLRAILLSKAGDIESQDNKANIPKLADVVPVSDALNALEQQARDYIYALREQTSLKGLPHEIAAKLKISTETFSEQVEIIAKKLEESKEQIKALSLDKERSELASAEQLQKITGLEKTIDELRLELSKKRNAEELEQLEKENKSLKQEIEQLNEKMQETRRELEEAKTATKQTLDKETQADLAVETSEEKFVYPTTEKVEEEQKKEEQEEVEEEDDEVFVYNGQDAPAEAKAPETNETLENAFKEKEQQMQAYYESQIRQLTEKLQMADGKAARFARLVDTLKERITAETDENARLVAENEKLHKECAKVQELLTTTETNYQNQVDMMTEYITQLQQQQQQMQGQR